MLSEPPSHDLTKICDFLGYGNEEAPLWFVGGEEGFGGRMTEAEMMASLQARAAWAPVRDMYEAHLEFTEAGSVIDISKKRSGSIAVWLWMSRIALVLSGATYAQACANAREYAYNRLGRSSGETFLTETSPIPCVRANEFHPAVRHLAQISSAGRLAELQRRRESYRPIVICYGLGRASSFGQMLGCDWEELPEQSGRILWSPAVRAFLLPFFGQGQMSHVLMKRFLEAPELQSLSRARGAAETS
jgi:hypothetical protein